MSTIAFVTTMPMSMSRPMSEGMPNGVPVASKSSTAPVAANGIDTSRMSGWTKLRKVAIMTRNTSTIATAIAIPS